MTLIYVSRNRFLIVWNLQICNVSIIEVEQGEKIQIQANIDCRCGSIDRRAIKKHTGASILKICLYGVEILSVKIVLE